MRDGAQIDELGPTLYERWQRLDIFVGNAGILGPLSPLGHISEADWSQTLNINVTANWRLLRTLDPILRLSPAGRVLFMTSGAAQNCRAYWGPYSVSKAALEALAKTYAHEVQSTPVRVNLLNPGPMRTRMRAQSLSGRGREYRAPAGGNRAAGALAADGGDHGERRALRLQGRRRLIPSRIAIDLYQIRSIAPKVPPHSASLPEGREDART